MVQAFVTVVYFGRFSSCPAGSELAIVVVCCVAVPLIVDNPISGSVSDSCNAEEEGGLQRDDNEVAYLSPASQFVSSFSIKPFGGGWDFIAPLVKFVHSVCSDFELARSSFVPNEVMV